LHKIGQYSNFMNKNCSHDNLTTLDAENK